MTAVRIFAISLNQTPLSWETNRDNISEALRAARKQGAELVCLPELSVCGYGCEDAFLWADTAARSLRVVEELLPETGGMAIAFGLPLWIEGELFNVALLACNGELIGGAGKRHLARDGIHYEHRWFMPWPKGRVSQVEIFGKKIPIGDVIFDLGGVRLAFEICEDAWIAERPAHELAGLVDVIFNPSASHFAFGKHLMRRQLVLDGARATRLAYVYCNLLGNEAGRAIYDGDCLLACGGSNPQIIAESRRFSFLAYQMAAATFTLNVEEARANATPIRPTIAYPLNFSDSSETVLLSSKTPGEDPSGALTREQAFGRATALGLFDYMRKSRARGFVVSLSGGADSAAVCLLVRLMVRLCWTERGARETVQALLPQSSNRTITEDELMARLLTTVYQSTENSSDVTRNAAKSVAAAIHARHYEVSVDEFVAGYSGKVEKVLGRELSWQDDDTTLQNIQARVRAPLVWMLANAQGALLLATSNRSEAAVGYATMDGDTAGGLSPIAGVDKFFLRSWLVFMEKVGISELGPIPELILINQQQPTAELRPSQLMQTDEDDLMPYEVLNVIERAALFERRSPAQVLALVMDRFNCERATALAWLVRFYRLFASSQWKRERFAPSFFMDEGSLDPKTWLRFPILSGGFELELRELQGWSAD